MDDPDVLTTDRYRDEADLWRKRAYQALGAKTVWMFLACGAWGFLLGEFLASLTR